jgi:hypothetical protein
VRLEVERSERVHSRKGIYAEAGLFCLPAGLSGQIAGSGGADLARSAASRRRSPSEWRTSPPASGGCHVLANLAEPSEPSTARCAAPVP